MGNGNAQNRGRRGAAPVGGGHVHSCPSQTTRPHTCPVAVRVFLGTAMLALGSGCLFTDAALVAAGDASAARRSTFSIAPRPGSPRQQAENVPTSVLLSWSPVPGATRYDVYLGLNTDPPLLATVNRTNYLVRDLPACAVHFWRVVATDDAGNAVSSPTQQFTTRCD